MTPESISVVEYGNKKEGENQGKNVGRREQMKRLETDGGVILWLFYTCVMSKVMMLSHAPDVNKDKTTSATDPGENRTFPSQ